MNLKQYSDMLHCLGVLEGIGYALADHAAGTLYFDTLKVLSGIIEELKPVAEGED